MANDSGTKMATCPICGYQETADDADALNSAMEEHMQSTHNLSMSSVNANADIKNEPISDNTTGNNIIDVPLTTAETAGFGLKNNTTL